VHDLLHHNVKGCHVRSSRVGGYAARTGAREPARRKGASAGWLDYSSARVQAPPSPSSTMKFERASVFSSVKEIGPASHSWPSAEASAATTASDSVDPAASIAQARSFMPS